MAYQIGDWTPGPAFPYEGGRHHLSTDSKRYEKEGVTEEHYSYPVVGQSLFQGTKLYWTCGGED